MDKHRFEQLARDIATKSPCQIRKVGAVLVSSLGSAVMAVGYNTPPVEALCNCTNGMSQPSTACPSDVVHAEVACLNQVKKNLIAKFYTMFVTHPPCNACLDAIRSFSERHEVTIDVHVCETFIKFDDSKLAYQLVPARWFELDAKIITDGAHKYKPNNWQHGDPERFYAALMRHLIAWRLGEKLDPDTGDSHMAHIRTNAGFLLYFDEKNEEQNSEDS